MCQDGAKTNLWGILKIPNFESNRRRYVPCRDSITNES